MRSLTPSRASSEWDRSIRRCRKVRRLGDLGPGEESDLFDLKELQSIATVLGPGNRDPEGYAELLAEVTRILTTGN
jgi:hypothetical protein